MSSMTDIVFLLLIFFLVTSTLINPNALKLLLPKSTGQVSAKATVSVSIKHWQKTDDFSFHINGNETPVRFDQIEDELIELLQTEEDPTFSIYADETVPIKEVVKVMKSLILMLLMKTLLILKSLARKELKLKAERVLKTL